MKSELIKELTGDSDLAAFEAKVVE